MRRESGARVVDVGAQGKVVKSDPLAKYFATDGCHDVQDTSTCPHRNTELILESNVAAVICCDGTGKGVEVGKKDLSDCIGGEEQQAQPAKNFTAAEKHCNDLGTGH